MDELGKVKRVLERQAPVDETLLVLDATTGQNGLIQARVFTEVVDVTGIVLTKLDGTARGGIVISVQRELGVPVKLVGLGEGADDLAPSTRSSSSTHCSVNRPEDGHVKALYKPAAAPGFELTERPEPQAGAGRGQDPGAAYRDLRHRPAHRGVGCLGGRRGQRAVGAGHEFCGEVVERGSRGSRRPRRGHRVRRGARGLWHLPKLPGRAAPSVHPHRQRRGQS